MVCDSDQSACTCEFIILYFSRSVKKMAYLREISLRQVKIKATILVNPNFPVALELQTCSRQVTNPGIKARAVNKLEKI